MKQYCRHCKNLAAGEIKFCVRKNEEIKDFQVRMSNECEDYDFTEKDMLFENPREITDDDVIKGQMTIEEYLKG